MLVAMTDHVHCNVEKRILRGRVGYVHSWMLHEEDHSTFEDCVHMLHNLPKVVFVKCYDKKRKELDWTLPGLSDEDSTQLFHAAVLGI